MEAKPLETIPEETVAPATTNKNITSDVPKTKPATAKNPGRVASGKRLAECNRLAREAKKQAEAQKPPTNSTTDASANATNNTTEQTSSAKSSTNTVYLILTVGGLIVSAFGVYYQHEAIMRTLGRSQKTQITQPAPAESNTVEEAVVAPKRKYGLREIKNLKSYIYTHHEA